MMAISRCRKELEDLLLSQGELTAEERTVLYMVRYFGSVRKAAEHLGVWYNHVNRVYHRVMEKHEERPIV
jgi:transposase-like protein